MEQNPGKARIGKSRFAQKLQADPVKAKQCAEIERKVRAAARSEIEAVARSQQLTPGDFAVYINVRAESTGQESD